MGGEICVKALGDRLEWLDGRWFWSADAWRSEVQSKILVATDNMEGLAINVNERGFTEGCR